MEYLKEYWYRLTKEDVKSFKWLYLIGAMINADALFIPELAGEPIWSVAIAFMIVIFVYTLISYPIYCALGMLIDRIFKI